MKPLKFIITNLILIAMLVILTGGMAYAATSWNVDISMERGNNQHTKRFEVKVLKNGEIQSLEDLNGVKIVLTNPEASDKTIDFDIYGENGIYKIYQGENDDDSDDKAEISYNLATKIFEIKPYERGNR